ncbi:LL-diaminopimelate aminotransferase [Propionivibrio dicarboxylicus]|uniref:LL-diaminopimelate aminotransferase n=1 Tax=Propionivibrio dicarboxylicus TaxID=83767 RepID=A0A1G8MLS2_9RHOO|nr:LL-diaminopimelate aminotransferase [Propionivibrio dicarboxylicus]SDI68892.1 LL-diaminopimelate aminotransferase apoenzyme [Propionivibrio dicarboxylicus]
MAFINENYLKLQAGYLFPEIARRVKAFADARPDVASRIIRCGIGDVTEPLPAACIAALHKAVDEMGVRETFRGYGPEQGYDFLRNAIADNDYKARGVDIDPDEIFVSDGSKCDCGNLLDIFGPGNRVAMMDPVYPVYVDTNVMLGNAGDPDGKGGFDKLTYLPCTAENGFVPELPKEPVDLIYLCYPNNPTGAVATREQLQKWVDFALSCHAVIVYDAAYEAFISSPEIPHSIFEIPGARECAIELRSFSKNGGFTGLRCGFAVIPKTLKGYRRNGETYPFHALWLRNHTTKFNGVAYPVQRAAEALYSPEGKAQVKQLIAFYKENARLLKEALSSVGLLVNGYADASYLWVRGPSGATSWDLFDRILQHANIVTTPGSGFGAAGEGYFRLSAFNSRANIEEACRRLVDPVLFTPFK